MIRFGLTLTFFLYFLCFYSIFLLGDILVAFLFWLSAAVLSITYVSRGGAK